MDRKDKRKSKEGRSKQFLVSIDSVSESYCTGSADLYWSLSIFFKLLSLTIKVISFSVLTFTEIFQGLSHIFLKISMLSGDPTIPVHILNTKKITRSPANINIICTFSISDHSHQVPNSLPGKSNKIVSV